MHSIDYSLSVPNNYLSNVHLQKQLISDTMALCVIFIPESASVIPVVYIHNGDKATQQPPDRAKLGL